MRIHFCLCFRVSLCCLPFSVWVWNSPFAKALARLNSSSSFWIVFVRSSCVFIFSSSLSWVILRFIMPMREALCRVAGRSYLWLFGFNKYTTPSRFSVRLVCRLLCRLSPLWRRRFRCSICQEKPGGRFLGLIGKVSWLRRILLRRLGAGLVEFPGF